MAFETTIIIAVPMVLEALSKFLNIKKEKLQEYYDTSQAFRDYVSSLTNSFNDDVNTELMQVTPSTTPRFDIPWITDELKKKQDDIFKIKQEITNIQTKAHQSAQEQYNQSPEAKKKTLTQLNMGLGSLFSNKTWGSKQKFYDRKKKETDQYTKQTNELINKAKEVSKRPLVNTNPTYQSIQERKRNAKASISEK